MEIEQNFFKLLSEDEKKRIEDNFNTKIFLQNNEDAVKEVDSVLKNSYIQALNDLTPIADPI